MPSSTTHSVFLIWCQTPCHLKMKPLQVWKWTNIRLCPGCVERSKQTCLAHSLSLFEASGLRPPYTPKSSNRLSVVSYAHSRFCPLQVWKYLTFDLWIGLQCKFLVFGKTHLFLCQDYSLFTLSSSDPLVTWRFTISPFAAENRTGLRQVCLRFESKKYRHAAIPGFFLWHPSLYHIQPWCSLLILLMVYLVVYKNTLWTNLIIIVHCVLSSVTLSITNSDEAC